MELLILLIKLIVRGLNGSGTTPPASSTQAAQQMEIARQIQARIEEARARAGQQEGPMMARLPTLQQRQSTQKQTGRQPTAMRAPSVRKISSPKRKSKRLAPPPLPASRQVAATAPTPMSKSLATSEPSSQVTSSRPRAVPSADAKLIARWLRPQTLRSQFVLTEIFQAPLSLRDSHLF